MSASDGRIPGVTDVPVRVQVRDVDGNLIEGASVGSTQVFALISGYRQDGGNYVGYGQLAKREAIGENGIADFGTVVDEDGVRIVVDEEGSSEVEGDVPADPDEPLNESWNVVAGEAGRPSQDGVQQVFPGASSLPDPVDPLAADGNPTFVHFVAKLVDDDGDTWVGATSGRPLRYTLELLSGGDGDANSVNLHVTDRLVGTASGYGLTTDRTKFGVDGSDSRFTRERATYGRIWAWQQVGAGDEPMTFNIEVTGTFRHRGLRPDPIDGQVGLIERYPTLDAFGNPTQYEDALLKHGTVYVDIPERVTVPVGQQRTGEDPLGLGNRVLPVSAVPAPRNNAESLSPDGAGPVAYKDPARIAQARSIYYTLLHRNAGTPSFDAPLRSVVRYLSNVYVSGGALDGSTSGGELVTGTQESILGGLAGVVSAGADAYDDLPEREVGRYAGVLGDGLGKASSLLTAKSLLKTAAGVVGNDGQEFTNRFVDASPFDPNEEDRYVATWDLNEEVPSIVVSAPVDLGSSATVSVRTLLEKPADPAVDFHPQFVDIFQRDYTLKPKRVPARSGGDGS